MVNSPNIAVLGATGLIGEAVTRFLMREGFAVTAIARRFNASQKVAFAANAIELPVVDETELLAPIFEARRIQIIVNCIGVLQDSARGATHDVHEGFVARLLALPQMASMLFMQISIPGMADTDATSFSRSKRNAEATIRSKARAYVILRPAFVIAPAAYGGSALIRALAALALRLVAAESQRPFGVTDVADIGSAIAIVARRWADEKDWHAEWEVMSLEPTTVGDVVEAFRAHFGGPRPLITIPSWLMSLGAAAGDMAAWLGWSPPMRTTALQEMRRGVHGDPRPFIEATRLLPRTLAMALSDLPATVQDKWFARLFLLKALSLAGLVAFWIVSGLIALTISFEAASAILEAHGLAAPLARTMTIVSSLIDMSVGVAIAFRKTCRFGLLAGIGVSLGYMGGAAVLTPELWIEPLGALVKTGPAIILMLVALATLDDR